MNGKKEDEEKENTHKTVNLQLFAYKGVYINSDIEPEVMIFALFPIKKCSRHFCVFCNFLRIFAA